MNSDALLKTCPDFKGQHFFNKRESHHSVLKKLLECYKLASIQFILTKISYRPLESKLFIEYKE